MAAPAPSIYPSTVRDVLLDRARQFERVALRALLRPSEFSAGQAAGYRHAAQILRSEALKCLDAPGWRPGYSTANSIPFAA